MPQPNALDHQLSVLEASGLIRQAAALPELAYLFRHALIQDAANISLLKADRRRLHRVVGDVLEQAYPEPPDWLSPLLALHFAEAGEPERALRYFSAAGTHAASQYANAEAASYFGSAIAQARQAHAGAARLTELYLSRGRALELSARDAEALAAYDELEALGRDQHEPAAELAALVARATIYASAREVRSDELAQKLSADALELAHTLNDRAAEAKILWNRMHTVRDMGQFQESVRLGEQSLSIARELDLREQMTYALHDLSLSYMFIGALDKAQAARLEAMDLWRALGNLPMLAEDLSYSAIHHVLYGEYAPALSDAGEALGISRRVGNTWGQAMSMMPGAQAHMELGQIDEAGEAMRQGLQWGAEAGFVPPQAQLAADLARMHAAMGRSEQGLEFARLSLQKTEVFPVYRLYAVAALAHAQLAAGQLAEAATLVAAALPELEAGEVFPPARFALMAAAIEVSLAVGDAGRALHLAEMLEPVLRALKFNYYLPQALYQLARALHALGRPAEAWEQTQAALAAGRAIDARWVLWQILEFGATLESERGNDAAVRELRSEAATLIRYIANHAGGLRDSFLSLPRVRALLVA